MKDILPSPDSIFMSPPPSKIRRALAAIIFAALIALLFACSDSSASPPIASAATPPPAPTFTPTPAPSPTPTVPSVISHSAAISEDNPLIAFVSVALSSPARVAVEYENEYAGKFRTALSERAAEHVIPVARLRADTTYEYAVGVETPDGALAYGARGEFVAGAVALFATMRSEASGRSSQSLILTDYFARFQYDNIASNSSYLIMRDELGEAVWIYEDAARTRPTHRRGTLSVRVLPNGNLIYMVGTLAEDQGLGFYEITPLGERVNKIITADRGDIAHHDFTMLDDGRILYIGSYDFVFDDSANGGDAETTARIGTLNIYDPKTDAFERVWDAAKFWDVTDPAQRVEWFEVIGVLSWVHLNSLSRSPDGGWIMSSRHRHQVVSVSPDFQTVQWQLGGPNSDFDFPDPTDRFDTQHTATHLPNGNILVFDNRADLPDGEGHYSRALELQLDFDAMTAVKAWEFSPDPPIYARIFSSAYRLDNGNTLINFGYLEDPANDPTAVIEVDAEGREIFRLETIDPTVAKEASIGPSRYRANPGPESVIGETMLRAPKPKG